MIKQNISLLIICFFLFSEAYTQYRTEIEVSNDCKQFIHNKQVHGQIATKEIPFVATLVYNLDLRFAYKDQTKILFIGINEFMFEKMEMGQIEMKLDDKKLNLGKLIDFVIDPKVNLSLEVVRTYYYGYELTDNLIDSILNSNECSISLPYSTGKRIVWNTKKKVFDDFKLAYLCFESNTNPVIQEYKNNLKEFETSFRKQKWKDNKETVIKTESSVPETNTDDLLSYEVLLNDDPFICFYQFHNNLLYRGVYQYNGEFVNENNFYNKYNGICKTLESKYGFPIKTKKYRNKELWNEKDEIGMAIQTGEYTEVRTWETKDSFIYAKIFGENFKTTIQIIYESKDIDLKKQVDKETLKQSIEDF